VVKTILLVAGGVVGGLAIAFVAFWWYFKDSFRSF
jgi:uncharacterized protein involved in exopolysaccharide biosynthesis